MGLLFSFIAILCESFGKTIDKINFRKNHITYRQMLLLAFFGMTVSTLGFILLTKQPFPHFTPITLGLVALIALFSFGGNVFDEISLKADDLSLREPMVDFEPILAGLVGYALFPGERKPMFLLAFLLGAMVVYWGTHRRKLRRIQKKGMTYLLIAAILYAFLPSIYQIALGYLSPAYITFFRVSSILVLLAIFLPVRKISKLSAPKVRYSFAAAIFYSIEAIVSLYAIKTLGVVLTMVLFMLGPAIRYWASSYILKEKVRAGEMISSFLLTIIVFVGVVK
jgi:drug/metabolite transporter (DMT)-like permease